MAFKRRLIHAWIAKVVSHVPFPGSAGAMFRKKRHPEAAAVNEARPALKGFDFFVSMDGTCRFWQKMRALVKWLSITGLRFENIKARCSKQYFPLL
jgi:hypothetical protein